MATVLRADRELDCKGLSCPMPVIKLSKEITRIEVGQILRMVATDPGSKQDMEAWARQTRHELLDAQADGNVFTFYVRRTR